MSSLVGPLATARYHVRCTARVWGFPIYLAATLAADTPEVGFLTNLATLSYAEAQDLRRAASEPVVVEYAG